MEIVALLTTLFIFGLFLAALLYQVRLRRRGVIVDFAEVDPWLAGLDGQRLKIRLEHGKEVWAKASGCTLCLHRFRVGDPVQVIHYRGDYLINMGLFCGRGSCSEAALPREERRR